MPLTDIADQAGVPARKARIVFGLLKRHGLNEVVVTVQFLASLVRKHIESKAAATVLTAAVDQPYGYGRIVRVRGRISRIVEERDASPAQRKIREINSGVYAFDLEAMGAVEGDPSAIWYNTAGIARIRAAEIARGTAMIASLRAATTRSPCRTPAGWPMSITSTTDASPASDPISTA